MKTSHFLLLGGGIAAIAFRDDIKTLFEKQTGKLASRASEFAASQVEIKPYKLPKVGLNLSTKSIRLSGSIYVENKSVVDCTLETYQIEVQLVKDLKLISLGKTPLLRPSKLISSKSKEKVSFVFDVPLSAINTLIDTKNITNYDLFITLKNVNVSGFNIPTTKIAIDSKWRTYLKALKDPTNLLDLIKF
ncbi:hypothetical protein L3073_06060 [Ancylomarina sp. DW003]|nr:hypothetical protein [Ancylomarina sp. DW003]MDE5421765.1 hypothetical protein [Ancylomarina sp. DW003]